MVIRNAGRIVNSRLGGPAYKYKLKIGLRMSCVKIYLNLFKDKTMIKTGIWLWSKEVLHLSNVLKYFKKPER